MGDTSLTIPKISPLGERRHLPTKARERILAVTINDEHYRGDPGAASEITEGGVTPLFDRVGIVEMCMSINP
jgi:hypothetical protein